MKWEKGTRQTQQQQHFSWSGEGGGPRRSAVSAVRHRAQTRKVCARCASGCHERESTATPSFPVWLLFFNVMLRWIPLDVLYHRVSPRQLTSPSVLCLHPVSHGIFAGSASRLLLRPVQTGCWIHIMPVKSHVISSRHGYKPGEVRCVIFFYK